MYPDNTYQPFTYETDEVVYFFTSALDPLSNWSAHAVDIWDMHFPTLEHAYHWRKYDAAAPDVAAQVLVAPSPWAAMQVDRRAGKGRRREDWQDVKVSVMEELMRAKVGQNQDVKECLLKTGTKRIIENSPVDAFWGCGPDGNGQNMTGKLLMKIREELRD